MSLMCIRFDDDGDGLGPDAWKSHQPGCVCPDCDGARQDAATPGQAELIALVDAHFVGDGPYPLQLVCITEDASGAECDQAIAEIEPGATWDELEARIVAHAIERHATAARQPKLAPDLGTAWRLLDEARAGLRELTERVTALAGEWVESAEHDEVRVRPTVISDARARTLRECADELRKRAAEVTDGTHA